MKATNNIEKKLNKYLKDNLKKESILESYSLADCETCYEKSTSKLKKQSFAGASNINNYLNNELDKNNFQKILFELIDKTGKKDSDIYNKAFIDRRLFSKIRNDINYHPSKSTVISLGLALNLDINNFEKLLNSASYSLPKNNYFDLIIRFCINEKIYNIIDVNNYLNKYNCNTLN